MEKYFDIERNMTRDLQTDYVSFALGYVYGFQ